MNSIYSDIQRSILNNEKLLAVLIDPDKFSVENVTSFFKKVNQSIATHIFIGGSTVEDKVTEVLVSEIKKHTKRPVIIFPGDVSQITDKADALLFLSLISGRNPEYLIGKHIESIPILKNTNLEVLPTGYILIESGKQTAVERVTKTQPIDRSNIQKITDTAKAGEFLGMKLMYLEAGSGALNPITNKIIAKVKDEIQIPLIVGGGIKNIVQLESAYNSGADIVVIGTAFEQCESFFDDLKK
ncbi:geranylgeranylglyceryl/heptaprenylglyceryl phosphate synthase [Jejuia spongiicola]|uniref:Geranylgeranylglyceryl phosphate synthase n=1 Tax=Jejuia spongiicola TaxID=2942207 RepID=A0ABT0QA61_9FLAO|nr:MULTISPECIES: geranylgeranylglyceryl/heptaprenylglyceryl phosphate synthase [Flavobacteriaceae]MCL6293796.1 geranylgeranylglyceryl/heptaprenylglyceryl phosphate synthase [Jejuia spongiicola]PIA78653.1 geranylgeranylglyceryl/heptaprenylglyceryl phosphate synthase [Gaetbulibacter sp. 4G1]